VRKIAWEYFSNKCDFPLLGLSVSSFLTLQSCTTYNQSVTTCDITVQIDCNITKLKLCVSHTMMPCFLIDMLLTVGPEEIWWHHWCYVSLCEHVWNAGKCIHLFHLCS